MGVRILTLGGLRVHRDSEELHALLSQPKRAALLVYLAVEGQVTREAAVGLLWPDSTKGRQSLSQTIFELKRELGEDWLEVQGEVLRTTSFLTVDAREFLDATEADEPARAVELYEGHFLAGVRLSREREFEEWAEDRWAPRLRMKHRKVRAAHIEGSRSAGELDVALSSARAWVMLEPFDDGPAQVLMELLAIANRPNDALEAYAALADRLDRDDPDTEPLDETRDLRDRIKSGEFEPEHIPAAAVSPPTQPSEPPTEPQSLTGKPPRRVRRSIAGLIPLVLALALVSLWNRFSTSPGAPLPLVVMPFAGVVAGSDAGDDISLLHRRFANALEWLEEVQILDGAALLEGEESAGSVRLETLLERTLQRKRHFLVIGEVSAASPSVLTITAYDATTGTQIYRNQGGGSSGGLDVGVSHLALDLLKRLVDLESIDLGPNRDIMNATESVVALGHLRRGQQSFFEEDNLSAIAAFESAVEADPSFGLAYFRLSRARQAAGRRESALDAVEAGLLQASDMASPWKELLSVQKMAVFGYPDSAVAGFAATVRDHPQNIDGWLALGDAHYELGGWAAHSMLDALPAYQQVLALDDGFAPILGKVVYLRLWQGNEVAARAAARRIHAGGPAAPAYRLAPEIVFGGRDEWAGLMAGLERYELSEMAVVSLKGGYMPTLTDSIGALLMRPTRTADDRQRGAHYRFLALLAQDREDAALAVAQSRPLPNTLDRFLVQAHLAGIDVGEMTRPSFDAAERLRDAGVTPDFSIGTITDERETFRMLVQRSFVEGDSAGATGLIREIEAALPGADRTDPMPTALLHSLQARLAYMAHDTSGTIRHLQQSVSRVPWPYIVVMPLTALAPQRLLLAELLLAQGRTFEAERWIRSFSETLAIGDAMYQSQARALSARVSDINED